jgi:phosphatidylglycerophosphate synthase
VNSWCRVLVYPSTGVIYLRLGLVGGAVYLACLSSVVDGASKSIAVVSLMAVSRLLDLVDGNLARRFGQTTTFGSVFDLLADLVTHTIVWWLSGLVFAPLMILLEWVAGTGILLTTWRGDARWKLALTRDGPRWIQAYFRNNQRNRVCAYGSVGHFLVPVIAYSQFDSIWTYGLTVPGLLIFELATVFLILAVARTIKKDPVERV